MKLKLQKLGDNSRISTDASNPSLSNQHTEAVLGVDWLNADEVLSCSDDHQILRWSVASGKATIINAQTIAKDKFFPTSMKIAQKTAGGAASGNKTSLHDTFLVTSTDGKVHLINTSGKVEKTIDAHQGAALCARWSNDGSSFVSCGEDGAVKMWSRSAMLRSVLANNGRAWEECFIKMLKAQTSPIKWKAHQGTVLCLQWSSATDLIVTGGEDCKYRLWDGLGRPLYTSNSHNHPITSLAWNTTGEMFAVGCYNILRLCDKAGWSHSLEKLSTGTIYSLNWSADGTQLVAGCANGSVYHAQVIEKRVMWENLEAVQTKRKTVDIRDLTSEVSHEKLETRDRVTKLQLGYNYLVVATTKQFYIFSAKNWNTPVIVDLKEGSISLILLCQKYFLMVVESTSSSNSTIQTLNYEGRVQATIRLPGVQQEIRLSTNLYIYGSHVVLPRYGYPSGVTPISGDGSQVVVLRTGVTLMVLKFETQTGKSAGDGKINHITDITEVAVNQFGLIADRRIAFVDANSECWLALVNSYGAAQRAEKLGSLVSNLCFNTSTNMLSAFQDQKLVVYTYPGVVFTDKDLLQATVLDLTNSNEVGGNASTISGGIDKSAFLIGFIGNTVTSSKWDQAVRICRAVKEDYLWATLAGLAAADKNYVVAEICYGQLFETEKVLLLGEIRSETDPQLKSAMMSCSMATGEKLTWL
uniref:Intraflagellar transport protein 80 homolog n=1 Tax=Ditylenchus dipsaci TaxID=166011 RepID=A0A915EGG2_9BILA